MNDPLISSRDATAVPAGSCPHVESKAPFMIDESVGYLMRRIVTLVGGEIERRMEPLGLTDAQWMACSEIV